MDRSFGNHSHGTDCWKHTLANFTELALSKTNRAGQGYTVSLGCPTHWDMQTTVLEHDDTDFPRTLKVEGHSQTNVALTLSIPEDRKESLQRCESLAKAVRVGDIKVFLEQLTAREDAPARKTFQGHHTRLAQDFKVEHSDPQWTQRRGHDSDDQPEKSSKSDSEARKYKEIVDYIMSVFQRRVVWIKERRFNKTTEARVGSNDSNRFYDHVDAARKNSFNRRSRCMDDFCEGFDSNNICVSEGISPVNKELCETCYPKRNEAVIEQHCAIQEIRERQVFYGVCILLGCAILMAAFLYALHGFCGRVRRRYQMFRGLWGPQSSRTSVTKSRSSSVLRDESMPALFPGLSFSRRLEILQRNNNSEAMEANGSATSLSILQRKWRKFDVYRKDSRRRLQDVFDIESLKEKLAEDTQNSDRVPVLPRAPNASIRMHIERMTPSHSSESFNRKELESSNDGSALC
ncbi:uncharacterized protein ACLA_023770 [Aspergillus clavatus NRRL 1]|uniref:Uncharacterized protein n=1 Tax=Aspergillus clavatus (strain ATCC 1007 / CBS 513.65 / DSM 816 / NCTC 3887 / NRRL 1 / QM 1276 / 107) TaxID=344612 RepID=A1CPU2_ASPCL|nr:uncharacterized protein ACLA_023770 [Aspergillus clavatus NRRL 1]EAW07663.1 hypothetical protein ACLA_023770 [Aspergillus clavatus NRRL 1]